MTTTTTITDELSGDVAELAKQAEHAKARMALLDDETRHALVSAPSDKELAEEREHAKRMRALEREQTRKAAEAAAAAADAARRVSAQIQEANHRDTITARKALAAQRRKADPRARVAGLYRKSTVVSVVLMAVMVAGILISATNVQRNIAGDAGVGEIRWWSGFFFEALVSALLIALMVTREAVSRYTTAALDRRISAPVEATLLGISVALNIYPYVRDELWWDTFVHSLPPIAMTGAVLAQHATSVAFGRALAEATAEVEAEPFAELAHPAHEPAHPAGQVREFAASEPAAEAEPAHSRTEPAQLAHEPAHPVADEPAQPAHPGDGDGAEIAANPRTEAAEPAHDEPAHTEPAQLAHEPAHPVDGARGVDAPTLPMPVVTVAAEAVTGEDAAAGAVREFGDEPAHPAAEAATAADEAGPVDDGPDPDDGGGVDPDRAPAHPEPAHNPRTGEPAHTEPAHSVRELQPSHAAHEVAHLPAHEVAHPEPARPVQGRATGEHSADSGEAAEADMWALAAEVFDRQTQRERSGGGIPDIAKVLLWHRRDGLTASQIDRNDRATHVEGQPRLTHQKCSRWIEYAAQIDAERAEMAGRVVRLHKQA